MTSAELDRLFLADFRLRAELLAMSSRPDWRVLISTRRAIAPAVVQATLPSRQVVRVCNVCVEELSRHQYFCPAVAKYSRSQLLREMVRVEDLEKSFDPAAPKLAGVRSRGMLRTEFWGWGWWLGFDVDRDDATSIETWRAARDDIRAEVEEMRARMKRKHQEDVAA